METLKTTMKENNKSLLNKIVTKMETMFIEFQTYMMKSTNELVQRLQVNKKPSSTNDARLLQVYDEGDNSVAKSNTSRKILTQEHVQIENKPNNFPGYQHPFRPSQMITQASQYPPYNMI